MERRVKNISEWFDVNFEGLLHRKGLRAVVTGGGGGVSRLWLSVEYFQGGSCTVPESTMRTACFIFL